jgi:hypothetical protein
LDASEDRRFQGLSNRPFLCSHFTSVRA